MALKLDKLMNLADLLHRLVSLDHPSIESILIARGFHYEADLIRDIRKEVKDIDKALES